MSNFTFFSAFSSSSVKKNNLSKNFHFFFGALSFYFSDCLLKPVRRAWKFISRKSSENLRLLSLLLQPISLPCFERPDFFILFRKVDKSRFFFIRHPLLRLHVFTNRDLVVKYFGQNVLVCFELSVNLIG